METRLTLDVTAESEAVMEKHFAEFLRGRGWHVRRPHDKWERTGDFCARVQIAQKNLSLHLYKWKERHGEEIPQDRRGPSQRLKALCSNPGFDAFCKNE